MNKPLALSRLGLVCMGSLGLWLGFPNDLLYVPPLILCWPLALFFLGHIEETPKSAWRWGFCLSMLGLSASLYWLMLPIHEVGGLPWILAAICAFAVPAILAAFFALFAVGIASTKHLPPVRHALFAAILWLVLEVVQAKVLDFPWVCVAGGLVGWPILVQGAVLIGSFGVSFVAVFALLLCTPSHITKQTISLGLVLWLGILGFGWYRLHTNPVTIPHDANSIGVLFVEGNADQNTKWTPSYQRAIVEKHRKLTLSGLSASSIPVSLIVWSETCIPFFFDHHPHLTALVRDTAKKSHTPLLFGTPGLKEIGTKRLIYNRAILLDENGATAGYADKEHLVPFGEYVPAVFDTPFFHKLLQGIGYSKGEHTSPLRLHGIAAGILICYEGIFQELAQKRVASGANIFVDLSNDAWFGATAAASQHLYLKALRSIEQNRWLLRGTNTGISAVIDHVGRIVAHGNRFTEEAFTAQARLTKERSFFHKTYGMQGILFIVLVGTGIFLAIVAKRTHRSALLR
ncbi:MAG: apolipoprotein N-acyltransferase [Desulfovibrio sp.]|nr:apolipoprotein N-acyltransferase [Desulfovibrio sp.]